VTGQDAIAYSFSSGQSGFGPWLPDLARRRTVEPAAELGRLL